LEGIAGMGRIEKKSLVYKVSPGIQMLLDYRKRR